MTGLFLTTSRVGNYPEAVCRLNSAFAVELGTQSFFHVGRGYALLFQVTLATTLVVVRQTGTSRNQSANHNVFFQAAQVITLTGNRTFGEYPGGFLERGRRNERLGGQGSLGENEGCEPAPDRIIACLKESIWSSENGKPLNFEVVDSGVTAQDSAEDLHAKLGKIDGDFFLGGDHSITYGLFKRFAQEHENPGLILFDAHPECYKVFDYPSHGDWLQRLVDEGTLKPQNIIIVGLRSFEKSELDYLKSKGIRYYTMKQLFYNIPNVCDSIMELSQPFDACYLSIDVDVLDPSCAPGTGYPEPGGLTTRELLYFLQRFTHLKNLKQVDLVEVNPSKDVSNMTVKVAAKIVGEFM